VAVRTHFLRWLLWVLIVDLLSGGSYIAKTVSLWLLKRIRTALVDRMEDSCLLTATLPVYETGVPAILGPTMASLVAVRLRLKH